MRVVGYVRVSTIEQAAEGVSLDAQRAKLALYAELHTLDLVEVLADEGVSASTLQRPGLEAALRMLDAGEADGLVVTKLDRLTRSVKDLGSLLDGYFGAEGKYQLLSVADSIDTRTASGRLVLNVLMSVAQWERETIVERTREAVAHKRKLGERVGQVPYGATLDRDGRSLVIDEADLVTIRMVAELRAQGLSLRAIAGELDSRGRPTKGGYPWSASSVRRILARSPGHAETTGTPGQCP